MKSIKNARLSKGLTQDRLATKVGVDQSAVSRWESGEYAPTETHLRKLNRVLFTGK